MIKILLIFLGTLSLGFGILGIVLPGLPTTPFLLLSAGLYLRSSEKLYQVIVQNRLVGPYILKFNNNKGMSLRAKVVAILIMWGMIFISVVFLVDSQALDLILFFVGLAGTIVMGFVIPTINSSDTDNN